HDRVRVRVVLRNEAGGRHFRGRLDVAGLVELLFQNGSEALGGLLELFARLRALEGDSLLPFGEPVPGLASRHFLEELFLGAGRDGAAYALAEPAFFDVFKISSSQQLGMRVRFVGARAAAASFWRSL